MIYLLGGLNTLFLPLIWKLFKLLLFLLTHIISSAFHRNLWFAIGTAVILRVRLHHSRRKSGTIGCFTCASAILAHADIALLLVVFVGLGFWSEQNTYFIIIWGADMKGCWCINIIQGVEVVWGRGIYLVGLLLYISMYQGAWMIDFMLPLGLAATVYLAQIGVLVGESRGKIYSDGWIIYSVSVLK